MFPATLIVHSISWVYILLFTHLVSLCHGIFTCHLPACLIICLPAAQQSVLAVTCFPASFCSNTLWSATLHQFLTSPYPSASACQNFLSSFLIPKNPDNKLFLIRSNSWICVSVWSLPELILTENGVVYYIIVSLRGLDAYIQYIHW